jgi:hypothetical protein
MVDVANNLLARVDIVVISERLLGAVHRRRRRILHLNPVRRSPRAIASIEALGDQAFINIKFHGSSLANALCGKLSPARRVGVPAP